MPITNHRRRPTRSPRFRPLAIAILATGVIAAGCGGTSPSQTETVAGEAHTSTSRAAPSSIAAPVGHGSGPLAFAECMRANGVPNFPDPQPGGGFVFSADGVNPASPAFQAAQSRCQKLMGGGAVGGPLIPGAKTHPSAQTLTKLVRIAQCMRQHGVPQFPDPRTSIPSNPAALGVRVVTNFDGVILLFPDTLNLQAPAYRRALAACGAPPLGLPH